MPSKDTQAFLIGSFVSCTAMLRVNSIKDCSFSVLVLPPSTRSRVAARPFGSLMSTELFSLFFKSPVFCNLEIKPPVALSIDCHKAFTFLFAVPSVMTRQSVFLVRTLLAVAVNSMVSPIISLFVLRFLLSKART